MILEITFIVVLIGFIYNLFKIPDGLPPGEWGLPIIGKMPPGGRDFRKFLENLRKKHGDIFTIKTGKLVNVYLCDFQDIKDTFSKNEFQGRAPLYTLNHFTDSKNIGLLFSRGEPWKLGRRFTMSHLRDFGLGTSRMNDIISYEGEAIIQHLDTKVDKPVKIDFAVNVAVLNVIWSLVAGRRYDIEDKELIWFSENINIMFEIYDGPMLLLNFFPWLTYVLPSFVKDNWMQDAALTKLRTEMQLFVKKVIVEHQEDLDEKNPRDYIDTYLIEMQKDGNIFYHDNLICSIIDLFVAGSETTSSNLRWFSLYMAAYPEVQEKAYQDISNVIPNDRQPSLDDKIKLPYMEAVIHEMKRNISFVPFAIAHEATDLNSTINGYKIPKGTLVNACVEMCHKSPKYWEKADEFYPEHFINEEGKFFIPKEGYLPFSIGKRTCLGESLAKMEIFLFATSILQRYQILPEDGVKIDLTASEFSNVLNMVPDYKVVLKRR